MLIRELIRRYLAAGPEVYDATYARVTIERVRGEFNALRAWLGDMPPQVPVAIALDRDYRYFLAVLACMDAGVPFVPLRAEWPGARAEQIRGIVGFTTCLRDPDFADIVRAPPPLRETRRPAPADMLYCMFTSGTTGAPKGVMIRRASYDNFLRWCGDCFHDVSRGDRLLNSTDFTFDVSLAEIALVLTRQCAFYSSRFRDDLFVLLNELHETRASVVATVPNNFSVLLDRRWLDRADLTGLRHALIAGSRFPVALAAKFRQLLPGTRIYNCYGPTEATIYCLARELAGDPASYVEHDTVSVGKALPGCLPLIVDHELLPARPGQHGELLMGGAQVMAGYLNDPQATARALVELDGVTYYRTGDIAFQDDRGEFFVTGRNDDTVKVSGQRVNLSDVDGYVQREDFVRTCATIAIPDDTRGVVLVLYVVASRPITREAAFAALREVLPRHQLPQDIRFVDAMPLNNSGKISKSALGKLYREERSTGD